MFMDVWLIMWFKKKKKNLKAACTQNPSTIYMLCFDVNNLKFLWLIHNMRPLAGRFFSPSEALRTFPFGLPTNSLQSLQNILIDSLTACFCSRISQCYQGHFMLARVFIGSALSLSVCLCVLKHECMISVIPVKWSSRGSGTGILLYCLTIHAICLFKGAVGPDF